MSRDNVLCSVLRDYAPHSLLRENVLCSVKMHFAVCCVRMHFAAHPVTMQFAVCCTTRQDISTRKSNATRIDLLLKLSLQFSLFFHQKRDHFVKFFEEDCSLTNLRQSTRRFGTDINSCCRLTIKKNTKIIPSMIISLFTVTDNVVNRVVFRPRKNYQPKKETMLNLRVGSLKSL